MKDASQTSLPSFNVPSQALFGSYCHDSQTPVNLTNENETLEDLIRYSGLSSQTNSDSIDLNSVKNKAELIGIPWDRLNDAQKCLFVFLCLRKQIPILYEMKNGNDDAVFEAVRLALNPKTPEYSKLEAFIRKGGDQKGTNCNELYQNFRRKHAGLVGAENNGYSIFNARTERGHDVLRPLFRFQTQNSVVCFLICAANAISYTMELRNASKPQEAFQQYSINIGRYMRNKLSNDHIYGCVFSERGGGYPQDILEDLLTHVTFANTNKQRTEEVDTDLFMRPDSPLANFPLGVFKFFKMKLEKYGPIMLSNFCTFPAFANNQETLFWGDWNDFDKFDGPQIYHAILITGVYKISDEVHGGVLFEAQDSLPGRPFLYLGYDLLKSMGFPIMHLIKDGVAFSGTPPAYAYDVEDTPQESYVSGNQSPVSGREEQQLTLSKGIVSVRKKLDFTFDTSLDWVGLDGFDRNDSIFT